MYMLLLNYVMNDFASLLIKIIYQKLIFGVEARNIQKFLKHNAYRKQYFFALRMQ